MAQKPRQEQILHILEKEGFVTVRYLTEVLRYSSATVNRDLNAMQALGLVKRSYGGVEAVGKGGLPPLTQRQFFRRKEKHRIAEAAVRLIQTGETVFLDGGTTVQYMLPFLLHRKDLRILTNSLRLAIDLGDTETEVVCLGGTIRERPHVLYGDETVEAAMKYHPDKMFFSVDRITAAGEVNCVYRLLYRTMLKNSRESYLLTDRTKLVDRLDLTLCDFSELTGVISDFEFPKETREKFPSVRFTALTEEPKKRPADL